GAGKPLGQNIAAQQAAYFQMHYLNATDQTLSAHVTVNAYAHAPGVAFTQTDVFATYNNSINIPPHATNDVETLTCSVPTGVKFWSMSTHAHKQAIKTHVRDGTASVFSSMDWEHPGANAWMTTPYYVFSSGKLTYSCTYNNIG